MEKSLGKYVVQLIDPLTGGRSSSILATIPEAVFQLNKMINNEHIDPEPYVLIIVETDRGTVLDPLCHVSTFIERYKDRIEAFQHELEMPPPSFNLEEQLEEERKRKDEEEKYHEELKNE